VRSFIRVLKTSPAAYVVHENRFIGLLAPYDILKQLRQSCPAPNFQTALGLVKVGLTDREAVFLCIICNPCALTSE
jgi:hypothetical protein